MLNYYILTWPRIALNSDLKLTLHIITSVWLEFWSDMWEDEALGGAASDKPSSSRGGAGWRLLYVLSSKKTSMPAGQEPWNAQLVVGQLHWGFLKGKEAIHRWLCAHYKMNPGILLEYLPIPADESKR